MVTHPSSCGHSNLLFLFSHHISVSGSTTHLWIAQDHSLYISRSQKPKSVVCEIGMLRIFSNQIYIQPKKNEMSVKWVKSKAEETIRGEREKNCGFQWVLNRTFSAKIFSVAALITHLKAKLNNHVQYLTKHVILFGFSHKFSFRCISYVKLVKCVFVSSESCC